MLTQFFTPPHLSDLLRTISHTHLICLSVSFGVCGGVDSDSREQGDGDHSTGSLDEEAGRLLLIFPGALMGQVLQRRFGSKAAVTVSVTVATHKARATLPTATLLHVKGIRFRTSLSFCGCHIDYPAAIAFPVAPIAVVLPVVLPMGVAIRGAPYVPSMDPPTVVVPRLKVCIVNCDMEDAVVLNLRPDQDTIFDVKELILASTNWFENLQPSRIFILDKAKGEGKVDSPILVTADGNLYVKRAPYDYLPLQVYEIWVTMQRPWLRPVIREDFMNVQFPRTINKFYILDTSEDPQTLMYEGKFMRSYLNAARGHQLWVAFNDNTD
ncbi:hypothetical protein BDK51DRAFT_29911 [Blyttiomyces helicus]|uniref:Uncharacterized protein n=1 Tax=Blyttiomyces helicus TaxID=388810 RepID=A0A4P9WH77_9FUNG|nr:hypothetical protein BDK51DRAFT_29911 [Blyttiomyces helicus]|eukprot:RKO91295.1 hypothetical protein BDK51DRAFT_29911 [Blyttiomyces helicus]